LIVLEQEEEKERQETIQNDEHGTEGEGRKGEERGANEEHEGKKDDLIIQNLWN
jgi:hypothetical protein